MGCSSGLWGYFPAIQPTGSPRKNRESFQQNRAPDGAFCVSARGKGGRFQMRPGCAKHCDGAWLRLLSCSGGMLHESYGSWLYSCPEM